MALIALRGFQLPTRVTFPRLSLRPRQPFIGVALAAIAGIVIADHWNPPLWTALAIVGVAAIGSLMKPRAWICWVLVMAAFCALHTQRFYGAAARMLAKEFEQGPKVVHASGIVATQPTLPTEWKRGVTCYFQMRVETFEVKDSATNARDILMNVEWPGVIPTYGDRVRLTGSAENLAPKRNPGQFDFTGYQQRKGVFTAVSSAFAQDAQIESHGHGSRLQAFAFDAQRWVQSRLALGLEDSPQIVALISSMVLGMQGETPEDTKELFQRTGTLHLFAVSGLNVAMLAGIALYILKPMRVTGTPAIFVTLPILAFYALVTGLGASCVRATIMATLLLLAPVFDRQTLAFNSLAASALLILSFDTNQLFLPGFQFSFVLVITIVLIANRIGNKCLPAGLPDVFLPRSLWNRRQRWRAAGWRMVAMAIGVTIAAWLGSLVFTAGYFHLFSPAAIFANLLAVPLAFLVLALGISALIAASISTAFAIIFNNANWLAAKALLGVIGVFARAPGGHVYVELPHLAAAPLCEVEILDVGEGAAVHLRSQGRDWLLDCGSAWSYDHIVLPYLRSRGVNRLDGMLISHGDTHHIGGAFSALDDFTPPCVLDSVLGDRSPTRSRLHGALADRKFGKRICLRGDRLRISPDTSLRVLFPPAGLKRAAADDKALVVQIETAGSRILFMSDSGFRTEQWLLENEPDLRSDIVVKGQHSTDFSGTLNFLARVAPRVVICSALGREKPPQNLGDWEASIAAKGIVVFRQDRYGAVKADLRAGGAIEVSSYLGGQFFVK